MSRVSSALPGRMLGGSRPSSSSSSNFELGKAVVISLARANDRGDTTVVFCLDENGAKNPFRLRNQDEHIFWSSQELRENGVGVGSIISYERCTQCDDYCMYLENTGKKVEVSEVVSQLPFGRLHRSLKDAFPSAVIGEKCGLYQETRPENPYILISISHAVIEDGRIILQTVVGEEVNLSNRSLTHSSNSIERVTLPVQVPASEEDFGDAVLVGFGSKPTDFGRFQAMCEGIILKPAQEDCGVLQSYRINSCPRGKCIVINNVTFDSETSERVGAQHDEGRLKDLFEELGFLVEIKTNLTRDDMYKLAKDVAAEDHSNFDGFVLIIMSHGGEGNVVCGIDGRAARIEEIMVEFKAISCETLRNKPKMFFIQCCRGECAEFMSPVQRHVDNPMPRFSNDSALANNPCPQEGDFLLSFAAAPGYYAYRRPDSGSVFLQVLVDVIRKHHQRSHLIEMLQEVTGKVVERGSLFGDKMPRVQVPTFSSTLRAKVYL